LNLSAFSDIWYQSRDPAGTWKWVSYLCI